MVVKGLIGVVLAVCIGVGCRWFGIPLPGPPAIFGAVLAVAMATGYTVTDKILRSHDSRVPPASSAATSRSELLPPSSG